jgi:hypothetical protein
MADISLFASDRFLSCTWWRALVLVRRSEACARARLRPPGDNVADQLRAACVRG